MQTIRMMFIRNTLILVGVLRDSLTEIRIEWRDRCGALALLMDPGTYDDDDYELAADIIARTAESRDLAA